MSDRQFNSATIVGMKSPGDVRIGKSPSPHIRWLQPGSGSEPPKNRGPTLRCLQLREVKCAALR
jgi:hypothetical protein